MGDEFAGAISLHSLEYFDRQFAFDDHQEHHLRIAQEIPLPCDGKVKRVLLDFDLAALYDVTTKAFNQAVRRNIDRFPSDFVLQLTEAEAKSSRSQTVTLKPGRGQHRKYPPLAFTEHGCLMLSNVLRSSRAMEVSVLIVRAFVQLRGAIAANRELSDRVDALSVTLHGQGRKLATPYRGNTPDFRLAMPGLRIHDSHLGLYGFRPACFGNPYRPIMDA